MAAELSITVNGEPRRVPEGTSAEDLVRSLGFESAAVAVEIDRRLVPRGERATRRLAEGEAVELVTLVGGG